MPLTTGLLALPSHPAGRLAELAQLAERTGYDYLWLADERFFREVARVLRSHGDLVVVEHFRDWANFMAFGPGFFHFLPETAWRNAAAAGGFEIRRQFRVTPFVNVFVLRRLL